MSATCRTSASPLVLLIAEEVAVCFVSFFSMEEAVLAFAGAVVPLLTGAETAPAFDGATAPLLAGAETAPAFDGATTPLLTGAETAPAFDGATTPLLAGAETTPVFAGAKTLPFPLETVAETGFESTRILQGKYDARTSFR